MANKAVETWLKRNFNIIETGGGCQALHRPLDSTQRGYIMITGEYGPELPSPSDERITIGVYAEIGKGAEANFIVKLTEKEAIKFVELVHRGFVQMDAY